MHTSVIKRILVIVITCLLLGLNVFLIYARNQSNFNFPQAKNIKQQHQAFFTHLLPTIDKYSRSLKYEHNRTLLLYKKYLHHQKITHAEYKFLNQLYQSDTYQVYSNFDLHCYACWKMLLQRSGNIPVSILLAQASIESNNGTSNMFKKSRNLFNVLCHEPRCGILIKNQYSLYITTSIRSCTSIEESIQLYINNLNISAEYQHFRQHRANLARIKSANGFQLLHCGSKKIKERIIPNREKICELIKKYQLTQYDNT